MAHEKDEAYPWHETPIDVVCNSIGTHSADQDSPDACPKVEQAYQIEQGDRNDKAVLLPWLRVWDALQEGGKRVREKEGRCQFQFVYRCTSRFRQRLESCARAVGSAGLQMKTESSVA
jgi:hypothetical protein